MARPPKIRITKHDEQELKRLVRNTKAKIRRTKKNYGIDLSNEVNIPSSVDDFETRKAFNEWKKQQKRFTRRSNRQFQFVKNEYDVVASKKELDDIVRKQKQAQQNVKKKRKELMRKMKQSQKGREDRKKILKQPDLQGFSIPNDFNFSKIRSQYRLEEVKQNYEKRANPEFYDESLSTFKDNLIRSIEGTLGAIDSDGNDDILDRLRAIPPDDFYELTQRDEYADFFNFEIWDSEGQMIPSVSEVMGNLSKLSGAVEDYENGQVDMDLKGF